MAKIKVVSATQLQKTMRGEECVAPEDSEVNPIFIDDLAPSPVTKVYGHPGIMKSGPNAGQMAESPLGPQRMTGPDRGKNKKEEKKLVGHTIVRVRRMTQGEMDDEGWDIRRGRLAPLIVELDNGTSLYASRDDEGNGPGTLFGYVDDERAYFEEES